MRTAATELAPSCLEGISLLQRGAAALARVENTGICVDIPYLEKASRDVQRRIADMLVEFKGSDVGQAWTNRYKDACNFQSRVQLAKVLSDDLGVELPKTNKGNLKTSATLLHGIGLPAVKKYLRICQLGKMQSTYIQGLIRECVDGKLHPFFNLHTVSTYRSSSDSINFQNIPVRDEEIKTMVRRAFIPRRGRCLVETDYSGIEVRIAACFHRDPVMIRYIKDPSKDMHRDMAAECYAVPVKEVTKELRFYAKNMFVFPQFYGDYFANCAKSLWDVVVKKKLCTVSDVSVVDILRKKGIRELGELDEYGSPYPGSFMEHLKNVEWFFWNKRFPVYKQWKDDWYADYLTRGWFASKTGFVCRGVFSKNQVINFPVQGSAFHCLLWSVIRIVLDKLPKLKMKTKVVGQIHDSILSDVPIEEYDDYCELVRLVMVTELQKVWDWIIVPLDIEITKYPESWAEAEKLEEV